MDSTKWCKSWAKDMYRCCPESCGNKRLAMDACMNLTGSGTCMRYAPGFSWLYGSGKLNGNTEVYGNVAFMLGWESNMLELFAAGHAPLNAGSSYVYDAKSRPPKTHHCV